MINFNNYDVCLSSVRYPLNIKCKDCLIPAILVSFSYFKKTWGEIYILSILCPECGNLFYTETKKVDNNYAFADWAFELVRNINHTESLKINKVFKKEDEKIALDMLD